MQKDKRHKAKDRKRLVRRSFFTYSLIMVCLTLLIPSSSISQEKEGVSFEAKLSKSKLGINERLRVDFTMNKDGDNFNPPDFKGFRVVL